MSDLEKLKLHLRRFQNGVAEYPNRTISMIEDLEAEQKNTLILLARKTTKVEDLRTENAGWNRACMRCGDENAALQEQVAALEAEKEILRKGLQSIANNSCCPPCQEARLVAINTLAEVREPFPVRNEAGNLLL